MDTQTEQKIRERAYELWMRHGSLPGRADEYWYQAEKEVLGEASSTDEAETHAIIGSDEEASEQAPVEVSSAPLGMTSETLDEVLSSPPAAVKPRKRRSAAAAVPSEGAETPVDPPKRRRSVRTVE